jgi:phospholipid/cholesterol/gamma-HCH transport system substrate-binding protein
MVTQAPKRSAIAIAVLFALSCIGLIVFVWTEFGGTIPFAAQGYEVHALFPQTGLLTPGADVRIAGVNVGRVLSVTSRGSESEVNMEIDQRFAPIPRDTRAILREKTLLGEAFIALSTGNGRGPKIPDGGAIPRANVQPVQELYNVLNSFTAPVRRDFEEFFDGAGNVLSNNSMELNNAFGNLAPASTELEAMVQVLNQQQGNLRTLINDGGTVLRTLGARSTQLQSLILNGNDVFTATAERNRALTRTIDALPPFLTQLKSTLRTVNTTLGIAKPSLNALIPVAPLLTPALKGLTTLSGPVLTLLHTAPGVLRTAVATLPDIRAFFVDFKPTLNALLPAAEQLSPIINIVKDYREYLIDGMANLAAILQATTPAGTTSSADGIPAGEAKYLRALITLGSDSVYGQTVREPGERSNAYPAPGELNNIATGGLLSASCSNTSDTSQAPFADANVPCRLQPGYAWGHGIKQSYYPHVTASAP